MTNYYCYDPLIKDIPDFPNYQISEDGTIYNKKTGRELKQSLAAGYREIGLCKEGKRKHKYIHRLLAEIFIENPNNYSQIDHVDKNKLNNSLNNLRWVTGHENCQNREIEKKNKSGIIGVSIKKTKNYKCYKTEIMAYGKTYYKLFPLTDEGFEQAKEWRKQKEKELFFKNLK